MKIVDITEKFRDMLESFECDFTLAEDNKDFPLSKIQELIDKEDKKVLHDIELLQELSFMLRHGQAQIITFEHDEDVEDE